MLQSVKGVVFDMDGTLTAPGAINFARICSRLKAPKGTGLIEFANVLPEPQR